MNLISSPLGEVSLGNLQGYAECSRLEDKAKSKWLSLYVYANYADIRLYLLAYVMVWRMPWLHSHNGL
jgi:hypothetical protein